MNSDVRRCLAELIGTFTLVFIGTAVATLQGFLGWDPSVGFLGISFAFGFTLMVLVWVIGPVSGCHVNPAVTIPMALSGRLKSSLVAGYLVAQILGAILASVVLLLLMKGLPGYLLGAHGLGANGNPTGMAVTALLGWEIVLTALFLFTIFAATREGVHICVTGLAIGGFLFVAHLVGAQLGDASLNPARSLGPAIIQGGDALAIVWVFILAPLVGGIVGWLLHRAVFAD
jgi:aquaporin Z